MNTKARTRIFASFEDADYYYRHLAVSDCRQEVDKAVASGDELAEVKGYEKLCQLLCAHRDLPWRQRFFEECLLPLASVITKPRALGPLYFFLGQQAFSLSRNDVLGYFERAIDNGDETVLDREDMLGRMPGLLIRGIRVRIEKSGRGVEVEKLEQRLERIVGDRQDASAYYLQLAELYQPRYRDVADVYFRKSIRAGSLEVAARPEFWTEAYESDYIGWFERLLAAGKGVRESAQEALVPLWNADAKGVGFGKSRQKYAESLWDGGLKADAAREFSMCADRGFGWAEDLICKHADEPCVVSSLSEGIVLRWFADTRENVSHECVLGRYFERHGRDSQSTTPKGRGCIARSRLASGDVMGAVRMCLEMDEKWESRTFVDLCGYRGFPSIVAEIRRKLWEEPGAIVCKDIHANGFGPVSVSGIEDFRLHADALTDEDVRVLREYFRVGTLDVSAIRDVGAPPLCARYLLLEKIVRMFTGSAAGELDARTLERQRKDFGRFADREFEDANRQKNPMTLLKWLIDQLFSSSAENERREGEAVLLQMVHNMQASDKPIPLLLLAVYWSRQGCPQERLLALRLMLNADVKVRRWLDAPLEDLFRLSFDELCESCR